MKKRKSKPTPGNTAFVSVAAWPNADRQTSVFRRSAIRCGIEVHFVDYGATWGGFYRHKILHLRGKLHELLERDMEYVICTDSRDVVFVDSAEAIIERFARLDQGGVLFGADKPRAVFPFTRPWFRQAVLEHCRHENEIVNTGTYAGTIEAVLDLFEHCDRLRTLACELDGQPKNNRERAIMEGRGRCFEDDQFYPQVLQMEGYEKIHVDTEKNIFAVFDHRYPTLAPRDNLSPADERSIGRALILHSPWLSRNHGVWEEWAVRERIIPAE